MKAFDTAVRRWLFCFAHPDDELTQVAFIRRLVLAGAQVSLSWSHDKPVRENEARNVARLLGVPADNLFFHHGQDQGIVDQIEELLPSYRSMIDLVRPDRVVTTAFEQGHIDHDATNYLVHRTFAGPVFETPLYHTYLTRWPRMGTFAQPEGQEVLALTPIEQDLKKRLARCYPSQTIWRNVLCYSALSVARGEGLVLRNSERLRLQTHRDFSRPNLPEPLASRVVGSAPWKRWEAAMATLEAKLRISERISVR